MMTSLIWWAKCCHPYLWLQFPILISALNVWLSISIFKIKIDKLASQNQNSIFKIMLWVVNIKIQIQDSKVAYQDWYSTSTFASLLGNIQYQNQNRSRHQIQHQFQEYCQYQHQNQPISIILPTSDAVVGKEQDWPPFPDSSSALDCEALLESNRRLGHKNHRLGHHFSWSSPQWVNF